MFSYPKYAKTRGGYQGRSTQTAEGRLGGAVNFGKFHWSLGQKVQVTLWLLGLHPQTPAKLLGTQNRSLELLSLFISYLPSLNQP